MTLSPLTLSYEPLTPTAFLERAAAAHADRVAVVDGELRLTYSELHDRCARLAGALVPLAGDAPVAVLAPNSHVMLEAHFGVPWAGVPLVAINTRLSAGEIAYILDHSRSAVLLFDPAFAEVIEKAVAELSAPPRLVRIGDELAALTASAPATIRRPADERSLLSINYTSGTTGRPKGVMYHHRGAYLQALAMVGHTGSVPALCICGRCRCSTATAGASRGRSPRPRARTSACPRSIPPRRGG